MEIKEKILYIANIRIPTEKAHGHQIMTMCDSFADAGMDVELLVPRRKNKNFKGISAFDFYKIKESFRLKKIFTFDPVWLFHMPSGWYIKAQAMFFMFFLSRYLMSKKYRSDYLFYTRDEYLLPLLQKFSDRVVWEGHSLPRRMDKYLPYFKKCRALVVLTSQIKNDLIAQGIDGKKILISPDGVDKEIFDIEIDRNTARQELDLDSSKLILGYTGSFNTKGQDKGINDILSALEKVKDNNILFFAVGGNQKDIDDYSQIAKDKGLDGQVKLLTKVSQDKLAKYQKAADILLMPYPDIKHYRSYMSPLKMFEYMISGTPIISSDLPSIREVLDDSTCVFCQPDDPDDLAKKISQLSEDKALGKKISAEAYRKVQDYTWKNRAKEILDFV